MLIMEGRKGYVYMYEEEFAMVGTLITGNDASWTRQNMPPTTL